MAGRRHATVVASFVAVAATLCVWSGSAGAATVVVGDPMTLGHDSSYYSSGATATVANTALSESGAHVTSPVTGTIVSWRVITTGTGEYALRVLRPSTGGEYTGAGRSPQNVTVAGDNTFSANLPIQTGDLVGVDIPDSQTDGISGHSLGAGGGVFSTWVPALSEGTSGAPLGSFTGLEMAINATVEYTETPSGPGTGGGTGTVTTVKKKCKKKKHKRSAESAKKKCKKKKKR